MIPGQSRERGRNQQNNPLEANVRLIDATVQQHYDQPCTLTFKTVDPSTHREEIVFVNIENTFELLHAAQAYNWDMKTASGKSAQNIVQFGERVAA